LRQSKTDEGGWTYPDTADPCLSEREKGRRHCCQNAAVRHKELRRMPRELTIARRLPMVGKVVGEIRLYEHLNGMETHVGRS
jgi:hypothetical protein